MTILSITEFGAIGDGKSINTLAFEKAIQHIDQLGGGTLVIPVGIYFTGAIRLCSNLTLVVEQGATLSSLMMLRIIQWLILVGKGLSKMCICLVFTDIISKMWLSPEMVRSMVMDKNGGIHSVMNEAILNTHDLI